MRHISLFLINNILDTVINSLIVVGQNAINAHFKEIPRFLGVIRPEHITFDAILVALVHKVLGKRSVLYELNLSKWFSIAASTIFALPSPAP